MATIPSNTKFIGYSDSIDFTERKTSSLNNLTEVYSMADIAASAGISGDMVAMASASGTPTENGQSIIDAYEKVKGKHVHKPVNVPDGISPSIENPSITLGGPEMPYMLITSSQQVIFDSNLIIGRKFKMDLEVFGYDTTGTQFTKMESLYFMPLEVTNPLAGGTDIIGYYLTEANEATYFPTQGGNDNWDDGVGFIYNSTKAMIPPGLGTPFNDQLMSVTPNLTTGPESPNTGIVVMQEVVTIKPTVLIPPGDYELPQDLIVDYPVDFIGMSQQGTYISLDANKTFKIGYGYTKILENNTQSVFGMLVGEFLFKDQSITFENMSINPGQFTELEYSHGGQIESYSNPQQQYTTQCGVRFIDCNLDGGHGNGVAGPSNPAIFELVNCRLSAGSLWMSGQFGAYNFIRDCVIEGVEGTSGIGNVVGQGAVAMVKPELAFGQSAMFTFFDFDNNTGKGLRYQDSGQNFNRIYARHSKFSYIDVEDNDLSPGQENVFNYVECGNTPAAGTTRIKNYTVGF